MKKNFVVFILIVLVFVACVGCAKSVYKTEDAWNFSYSAFDEKAKIETPAMAVSGSIEYGAEYDMADAAVLQEEATIDERKLVKTGDMSIRVNELSGLEEIVCRWCESFGGYVSFSERDTSSAYFVVKIPCEKFDEAISSAGSFGEIRRHSVSVLDVSEQFYDLEARINSKKKLRESLERHLEEATDMKDIVEIEREMNNIITELESMEGRQRHLAHQINYSTLNMSFSLPVGKSSPDLHKPSFSEQIGELFYGAKEFFLFFLHLFFYVVVCGIPCVLLIALVVKWLFGKDGIGRRFFRFIKK